MTDTEEIAFESVRVQEPKTLSEVNSSNSPRPQILKKKDEAQFAGEKLGNEPALHIIQH